MVMTLTMNSRHDEKSIMNFNLRFRARQIALCDFTNLDIKLRDNNGFELDLCI